jgi:hypothetical protein
VSHDKAYASQNIPSGEEDLTSESDEGLSKTSDSRYSASVS